MRFEIGEKVLCIESTIHTETAPLVTKGKTYTVSHFEFCGACGIQRLTLLGVLVPPNPKCWSGKIECVCGHLSAPFHRGVLVSKKFVKIDEDTMHSLAEKEEYELAQIIKDQLITSL